MSDDKQEWAKMLAEIGEGSELVWISVTPSTCDTPAFEGKSGWLRFMNAADKENLTTGTLPAPDNRFLMSGEWVDGGATVSAKRRGDTMELRTIAEVAADAANAIPALRDKIETLTRAVPGRAQKYMQFAVYMGFKSQSDFDEGKLTTVGERFIGFSDTSLSAPQSNTGAA